MVELVGGWGYATEGLADAFRKTAQVGCFSDFLLDIFALQFIHQFRCRLY